MQSERKTVTLLGQGSFGKVELIYDEAAKPPVFRAVKTSRRKLDDQNRRIRYGREVEILKSAEMLSMVKMTSYNIQEKEASLEFEFIPGGTLADWLAPKLRQHLTPTKIHIILYGIARALEFLHKKEIVHRDVKPQNVLLTHACEPKLCDFGFARFLPEDRQRLSRCGTQGFIAPEILASKEEDLQYDTSVDVYSFGMLIYNVVTGNAPPKEGIPELEAKPGNDSYREVYGACAVHDPSGRRSMADVVKMLEKPFPDVDDEVFTGYKDKFEKFKWEDSCTPVFLKVHTDNPVVCYYLGLLYSLGIGCDKDERRAEELKREAARMGFERAKPLPSEEEESGRAAERQPSMWQGTSSASLCARELSSVLGSGVK